MGSTTAAIATVQKASLSSIFASKYGIDQTKVYAILKDTVLKSKDPVSDAEVAAFMIVANNYDLNPFIKEIYGFVSKGKMQYVVSVDGWATLINRQPALNGIEFELEFRNDKPWSCTCKIHRKDRAIPTVIPEYFSECSRDNDVWKQWPVRMLRHKALIQCARLAFGLAGVMDEDEAERMDGYQYTQAPIEGRVMQIAPGVKKLGDQLGWTPTKLRSAVANFNGNTPELMEYLKAELAKISQVKDDSVVEGEIVDDSQAESEAQVEDAQEPVQEEVKPETSKKTTRNAAAEW